MTGKSIPVNTTLLMEYVINSLTKYHEYVESTGEEPEFNPYRDPIIYRLEDGRSIEIPEQVKTEAIKHWKNRDSKPINNMYSDIDEEPNNLLVNRKHLQKPLEVEQSLNIQPKEKVIIVKEESSSNYIYIAIIVLLLGLGFYLYKNNKLSLI